MRGGGEIKMWEFYSRGSMLKWGRWKEKIGGFGDLSVHRFERHSITKYILSLLPLVWWWPLKCRSVKFLETVILRSSDHRGTKSLS